MVKHVISLKNNQLHVFLNSKFGSWVGWGSGIKHVLVIFLENISSMQTFFFFTWAYDRYTIVPFKVWHKLNDFLICQIFWILIVSYDKN